MGLSPAMARICFQRYDQSWRRRASAALRRLISQSRSGLERLINVKHVPLSRELKQRPVKTLQSAAQAVNVDHPCWGVRVRAETDRVHRIGKEVARPSNYFADRVYASFETNKHMIES